MSKVATVSSFLVFSFERMVPRVKQNRSFVCVEVLSTTPAVQDTRKSISLARQGGRRPRVVAARVVKFRLPGVRYLGQVTQPQVTSRSTVARYGQLLLGCTVLGVGVAMVLTAKLGSDGYSTLVSGLTVWTGLPFWLLNVVVGAVFVAAAWLRGRKPGPGTLVQWFHVGFVISIVLELLPEGDSLVGRSFMLTGGLVLIAFGVAAYLASNTGAGPAEAMALSFDPPLPFRWSYSILQLTCAAAGWLMDASVGPGTVLIFLLMGPAVDLIRRWWQWLEFPPIKMVA